MKINFAKLLESEKVRAGGYASAVNWKMLADKIGVSPQLMFYWKSKKSIPNKWVEVINQKLDIFLVDFEDAST
jgi:hypothetical protein